MSVVDKILSPALVQFGLGGIFSPFARKIINKASTNVSQGSQEEALQKDIKLSLDDSIDEEDHEQNYFRM